LDWAIKQALFDGWRGRRGTRGQTESGASPNEQSAVELLAIDTRYGQLGSKGIFQAMDRAGVLTHRVAGVGQVDSALTAPPFTTRSALRGGCIHRFSDNAHDYTCDWSRVVDLREKRVLDMSDPFTDEERWQPLPATDRWSEDVPFGEMVTAILASHQDKLAVGPPSEQDRLHVGDRVTVSSARERSELHHLERDAMIVAVVADGGDPFYRLDIDDGKSEWPGRCLRRIEVASGTCRGT